MAEESVSANFDISGSLFKCCYCRRTLNDPVSLSCLHHCCQECLESISKTGLVNCPTCRKVTELNATAPNVFLRSYIRQSALCADTVLCSKCDSEHEQAQYWCADCRLGLCAICYSWHNKFNESHCSAEIEVARTWSLSQRTPAGQCSLHKRQTDVLCFACRGPKCPQCYESWQTGSDLHSLWHEENMKQVSTTMEAIRIKSDRLIGLLASLRTKLMGVTNRQQGTCRTNGHTMLLQRRRCLHDAAVNAFERSVEEVCFNIHSMQIKCTELSVERRTLNNTATSAGCSINQHSMLRRKSSYLLRQKHQLKMVAQRCVSSYGALRSQLLELQERLIVSGSVPCTPGMEKKLKDFFEATPPVPLFAEKPVVTVRTPVHISDFALTPDGHVLLAVDANGLLVYSDQGKHLSTWQPNLRESGEPDMVRTVAALTDGRAAVGVYWAQLVVMLRRSSGRVRDTWLEECRVAELQSWPRRLAVHGDLMALLQGTLEQDHAVPGREVQLMRLSSGQLLSRQSRRYNIKRVALTALCVVTTSRNSMSSDSFRAPSIIEAFTHSGEFLWRRETSDDEAVKGVCAAAIWRRVYVIVVRREDESLGRVTAIGEAHGRDKGIVMRSPSQRVHSPHQLSLARVQHKTVLAVLNWDETIQRRNIVKVYEATSDVRQTIRRSDS